MGTTLTCGCVVGSNGKYIERCEIHVPMRPLAPVPDTTIGHCTTCGAPMFIQIGCVVCARKAEQERLTRVLEDARLWRVAEHDLVCCPECGAAVKDHFRHIDWHLREGR